MPQVIRDVTADLNPSYNNWDGDDMAHSFGIGSNHFPPSFTDWDGDGSLDLFFNNHYKADFAADFDLGVSRLKNGTPSALQIEFLSIGIETFVDGDSKQMNHDCHGSTFADIDGDGILDLLISVGGDWGAGVGEIHDNMLFWGEETSEGDFRLVGGREAATAAGVQCSNCRGRYMLVTDANRDGKLDIFPVSDNRVDDIQTPTPLLLNNDDKTFTEHPSFMSLPELSSSPTRTGTAMPKSTWFSEPLASEILPSLIIQSGLIMSFARLDPRKQPLFTSTMMQ